MADKFAPMVASVVPVLNEEFTIVPCLESLCRQSYPGKLHQIHIFDGGSSDATWRVAMEYVESRGERHPRIFLHQNLGKHVAEARNLALKVIPESVEYMLEIIGHCTIADEHISELVTKMGELQRKTNNNVGALGCKVTARDGKLGVQESWIEAALSSPLASGNGQFENFTGTVETSVPAFCLHYRVALDEVDGWNNEFITSQDSDLSMRLKYRGYQLFKTDIVTVRMAKRTSIVSWGKMGFRYGFWRTRLVKIHPRRLRLREFLPWFGLILTIILLLSGTSYWSIPAMIYIIVLAAEGLRISLHKRQLTSIIGLPISIITLHMTFSIGLLYGLFGKPRSFNDRESINGKVN